VRAVVDHEPSTSLGDGLTVPEALPLQATRWTLHDLVCASGHKVSEPNPVEL